MVVVHYGFDPDVQRVVNLAKKQFPGLHAYTYLGHPWAGWDGRSIDFEGNAESIWGPIPVRRGWNLISYLMGLQGAPYIRHWIYSHTLWTSFGGYSRWEPDDHAGEARHLHVTYWPPT